MKGKDSPSIAGGGVAGINELEPELLPSFLTEAVRKYKQLGYKKGDSIPDLYGEIGERAKISLLVGSKSTGGPIHFCIRDRWMCQVGWMARTRQ